MGLKNKKKVFFIVPSLAPSGAELFFYRLSNELARDYDVSLVSLTQVNEEISLPNNFKLVRFKCSRSLEALPRLFLFLAREKPNVVFSTLIQANAIVALIAPFFKDILFYARETLIPSKEYKERSKKIIPRFVSQFLYTNYKAIIFQSQLMKEDHKEEFRADYNSVIINNFISDNALENNTQRSQSNPINFFTIARLNKVKQISHILKALKLTLEFKKEVQLHIFGDGDQRKNLENEAKTLGITDHVTFHGFINNPIKKCYSYDALLMTSEYEGFPNAILESLSIGKPVITYNSPGGIKEIMSTKQFGVLAPYNDIQSLANSMQGFHPSQFDSSKIKDLALTRFGRDRVILKYKGLID